MTWAGQGNRDFRSVGDPDPRRVLGLRCPTYDDSRANARVVPAAALGASRIMG
jgi:hypothetical protein